MAKLLAIVSLLSCISLTTKCNSNEHRIDTPFGLEWNMSFNDMAAYVKNDTSGNILSSELFQEYSKCEKFTRTSMGAKYYGKDTWVDLYLWNDSLFRIEFFADIDDPLELPGINTLDDMADIEYDTLNKEIESKSIEKEVNRIKTMILANHKDCIKREEIDTVYWEMKYLPESAHRMTRNIRCFGYDNTIIKIAVTTNRNSDGTFQSKGSLIVLIAYSSPGSEHIYNELENWQNEHGKINRNSFWSAPPVNINLPNATDSIPVGGIDPNHIHD